MIRLNIGSHSKRIDGFLNVDIEAFDGVDYTCDLTKTPWELGRTRNTQGHIGVLGTDSVDEILMIEVLEHISFHDTAKVLKEIYRVLKPGGKIHVQVPDCGSMMEMFVKGEVGPEMPHKASEEEALDIIATGGPKVHPTRFLMAFCGAQKYGVPDIHKNIFWKDRLEDSLEDAGFDRIDFKEDPLGWKIRVNAYKTI